MNALGIRAQKKKQAEDFIRSYLIKLHHGQALPSIRQLMTMSGLGRIVIEQAIESYIEKKLITAEPRRGYFRTSKDNNLENNKVVHIIGCSCVGYLNCESFQNHLIQHLFQIGSDLGISMWVNSVSYYDTISTYTDLVVNKKIRNCFLISPENREIAKQMKQLGSQCVVIAPHYDIRNGKTEGPAVIDADDLLEKQMNYLFKRGHKNIAFIYADGEYFSSFPHLARREYYYKSMAEAGIKIYPHWVIPAWSPEKKLRQDLEKMFLSNPRPSAVICHEYYLPLVYSFLNSIHLVIGRDVSVITDGEGSRLRPPPTIIKNTPQTMAEIAWDMMENLINGEDDCRILPQKLDIEEGKTVSSLIHF